MLTIALRTCVHQMMKKQHEADADDQKLIVCIYKWSVWLWKSALTAHLILLYALAKSHISKSYTT